MISTAAFQPAAGLQLTPKLVLQHPILISTAGFQPNVT
jgi:hypothetical protein